MAGITLSDQTIALYNKLCDSLLGKNSFVYDGTNSSPMYESMRSMPALKLAGNAATGDTTLFVRNAHLYPKSGTILIGDAVGHDTETLSYKRVINATSHNNNAPTWTGIGNPPDGYLVLNSAVLAATTGTYHAAHSQIWLQDQQVQGFVPSRAGWISNQDLAAFLRLLKAACSSATLTTSADGTTTTLNDNLAFTGTNSLIGNKVTIVTGTLIASGETSYIVSNTANALVLSPAFSAITKNGDTYTIECTFFDKYIDDLEHQVPFKLDTDGVPAHTEHGPADNPTSHGSTIAVAPLFRIIDQLGGSFWSYFAAMNEVSRGLIGFDMPSFTILTKKGTTGDTILYVHDASRLPQVEPGQRENLTIIGAASGAIVQMIKNYRRPTGMGLNQIELRSALGGDINLPAIVMWSREATSAKTCDADGAADGTTLVDGAASPNFEFSSDGTATGILVDEVGHRITIVTNPGGIAPQGEVSYVTSNTRSTLTVDPPFSAKVLTNATYKNEPDRSQVYLTSNARKLPESGIPNGVSLYDYLTLAKTTVEAWTLPTP